MSMKSTDLLLECPSATRCSTSTMTFWTYEDLRWSPSCLAPLEVKTVVIGGTHL